MPKKPFSYLIKCLYTKTAKPQVKITRFSFLQHDHHTKQNTSHDQMAELKAF